jgi:DNA-binding SARP family transcriptional activator
VQICGRLAVTWEGTRIESLLPARQGRLLLVYLVAHRRRLVSRDELVAALWPAEPPPAAESTLRAVTSRLRRVLGADAVPRADDPRIVLPEDAFVDLEAAREALHRAEAAIAEGDWARAWAPARVALHTADRGFLPGHDGSWIAELQRELEEMRLRALECVGASGLGLGGAELDAAERSGRRLVAEAPFRESGYRVLMQAHAARGNTAEALLAFERLRTLLRDELGIAPSTVTRDMFEQLLRGDRPPVSASRPARSPACRARGSRSGPARP